MGRRSLHFYPGQKLLLFLEGTNELLRTEAWGGPSTTIRSPVMSQGPTNPGSYVIGWVGAYVTRTWPMSKIRWGVELRDSGTDVLHKVGADRWGSVYKTVGVTRDDVIAMNLALYGVAAVPKTWVFNDFGPQAIRYFKDRNHNGKLDGKESLEGEMFHTTPDNEAQQAQKQPIAMAESHGCIHLLPLGRDQFTKAGAFAIGTALIIHPYSAEYKAP